MTSSRDRESFAFEGAVLERQSARFIHFNRTASSLQHRPLGASFEQCCTL